MLKTAKFLQRVRKVLGDFLTLMEGASNSSRIDSPSADAKDAKRIVPEYESSGDKKSPAWQALSETELSGSIQLDSRYWDCECAENYIHPHSDDCCAVCGATRDESPDSRVAEILYFETTIRDDRGVSVRFNPVTRAVTFRFDKHEARGTIVFSVTPRGLAITSPDAGKEPVVEIDLFSDEARDEGMEGLPVIVHINEASSVNFAPNEVDVNHDGKSFTFLSRETWFEDLPIIESAMTVHNKNGCKIEVGDTDFGSAVTFTFDAVNLKGTVIVRESAYGLIIYLPEISADSLMAFDLFYRSPAASEANLGKRGILLSFYVPGGSDYSVADLEISPNQATLCVPDYDGREYKFAIERGA